LKDERAGKRNINLTLVVALTAVTNSTIVPITTQVEATTI
jgi:hypothetical protein